MRCGLLLLGQSEQDIQDERWMRLQSLLPALPQPVCSVTKSRLEHSILQFYKGMGIITQLQSTVHSKLQNGVGAVGEGFG